MYIIIDILIFRVSMNDKGDKFQLGIDQIPVRLESW
jgi:hypothetical protein